ncbi:MAG: CopD family protein [Sphingomonas sp.]
MGAAVARVTDGIVTAVKFLHIAALSLWCAGLIALPLLLALHDPRRQQHLYARLRIVTHSAYTRLVTPAAVVSIAAGTALIYLRGTWVPWFFAKLLFVGVLALVHAFIGHVTLQMGERDGDYCPPPAWPIVGVAIAAMIVILTLVLAKPAIGTDLMPGWMTSPMHQPLPVDEVPI